SQVYGSDAGRAAALRTNGGTGAKLLASAGNLLPFNSTGLPNQNQGPLPNEQLLLAGDIRANENIGLLAMHTLFLREHNRLVDRIAIQQPGLSQEQQYQLARKIVGAEMQIVTYGEFLPALLGTSAAPLPTAYQYDAQLRPDITQSFAHAAFRFGHSTVSSSAALVGNEGAWTGDISLGDGSFNPTWLTQGTTSIEAILKGAAAQTAQETDTRVVDGLRNIPFGPPGAGGTDLAAVDIQRGRDHGLPDYNFLRVLYTLSSYSQFSQITSNEMTAQTLSNLYGGNLSNVDAWIAGMAEDHAPDASVGPLFQAIIAQQFERLRDGDRLFYLSDEAGLYSGGNLRPEIASIVDLDSLRLSGLLRLNTSLTNLQEDAFFAARFVRSGDFNADQRMDCQDIDLLVANIASGQGSVALDLTGDQLLDHQDITAWLVEAGYRELPSQRPYLMGDANLDGAVDGGDFIVWNMHKFTGTAAWCSGDFNADGIVDGTDFNLWNANKFQSALTNVAIVPEPLFPRAAICAVLLVWLSTKAGPWTPRAAGSPISKA
ncbi:MAG TPA: peroxidase family protein, partial [Pirellulaceae bacterium]